MNKQVCKLIVSLAILAVQWPIVSPTSAFVQESPPATSRWRSSTNVSVKLSVRPKGPLSGATEVVFVVKSSGNIHFTTKMVSAEETVSAYFPDDFKAEPKAGSYSWKCLVDGAVVASGSFSYGSTDDRENFLTFEEFEKERAIYEQQAEATSSTIGPGYYDLWLWAKIRSALLTTDEIGADTIKIDVDLCVVTVTGQVGSEREKAVVHRVIRETDLVKAIMNKLTVAAN